MGRNGEVKSDGHCAFGNHPFLPCYEKFGEAAKFFIQRSKKWNCFRLEIVVHIFFPSVHLGSMKNLELEFLILNLWEEGKMGKLLLRVR